MKPILKPLLKPILKPILILITTLFVFSLISFADSGKTTIKVGYWPEYGIFVEKDGQLAGYGYDYMMKIAKINNWDVEFIAGDWSKGLEMLETGEIDIFGAMQKNPEREQIYDYTDMNFGFEYGALYVSESNKDIFYNNAESLDGKTVGTSSDNYFITLLEKYSNEIGITFQYEYIDDSEALQAALESGQIDLLLSGSIRNVPNSKVALRFSSDPIYYATTKGNKTVLDGLNYALKEIKRENIYYDAELHNKYYQHTSISRETFTLEERQFIDTKPKLRVVLHDNWKPINYYDKNDQRFSGITVDVLEFISEYSGIDFEYVRSKDYADSMNMLQTNQVDIVGGLIDSELISDQYHLISTKPYLDSSFVFVGKRGGTMNTSMSMHVSVLEDSIDSVFRLKQYYPNINIKEYKSFEKCLNAVLDGEVEYTVLNSYSVDDLLRGNAFNELAVVSILQSEVPIGFGVSRETPKALVSILNKSIDAIGSFEKDSIIFNYTVGIPYNPSIKERINQNFHFLIGFVFVFFVAIISFILWLKSAKSKILNKVAYYDSLTNRINFVKFKENLEELLAERPNNSWAVLSLDIDKFKTVNDMFGYEVGDKLITHLSDCIAEELKKDEFFARENADRFIILMNYVDEADFERRFYQIVNLVSQEHKATDTVIKCSLSGGLYLIKPDEHNITAIIDRANFVRMTVKSSHKDTYAVYTQDMYEKLNMEKQIEDIMVESLIHEEFLIYLQPKFSVETKVLVGAEALVRWDHPERGLILPNYFIPLFEKNGFIVNLDFYVFQQVCKKLKEWNQKNYKQVPISINLSRCHIENKSLGQELLVIAQKYELSPEALELELTENAFADYSTPMLIQRMNNLHNFGFLLSMDDFGAGLSSLTQLRELPIDIVKLDKSFFGQGPLSKKEKALFKNVVNMAKDLGIITVAEGIETEEQYQLLYEAGCDIAQGYLFARPMPINDFEDKYLCR